MRRVPLPIQQPAGMMPPLSLFLLCLVASCGSNRPVEISRTRHQLGTTVTLTVIHTREDRGLKAIAAAFDEVERIERLMSSYDRESEVSRLNAEGRIDADPELVGLVEKALHFSQLSGGAFDISIQPLLELFETTFGERGGPPAVGEVEAARALVGFDRISVSGNTISIAGGMRVTLGGIAKGYALDRAVSVLREHGVERALVNAGGDMRALGEGMEGPWRIALQNPRDRGDYLAVLPLSGMAVATSGDYERYFDPEMEYHHIIDPRTGLSAKGLISVTIVAPSAVEADALATAVFVLGRGKGMELVESLDDVEAMVITSEREVVVSSGLEYSTPEGG